MKFCSSFVLAALFAGIGHDIAPYLQPAPPERLQDLMAEPTQLIGNFGTGQPMLEQPIAAPVQSFAPQQVIRRRYEQRQEEYQIEVPYTEWEERTETRTRIKMVPQEEQYEVKIKIPITKTRLETRTRIVNVPIDEYVPVCEPCVPCDPCQPYYQPGYLPQPGYGYSQPQIVNFAPTSTFTPRYQMEYDVAPRGRFDAMFERRYERGRNRRAPAIDHIPTFPYGGGTYQNGGACFGPGCNAGAYLQPAYDETGAGGFTGRQTCIGGQCLADRDVGCRERRQRRRAARLIGNRLRP